MSRTQEHQPSAAAHPAREGRRVEGHDVAPGSDVTVQRRTGELVSWLEHATPQERRQIRDEIVTMHLGLADRAARRYGRPGQHEDLLQVARIGLVEAFDRYDPSRAAYPTFAWSTMTGLLRRHLRDHGWSVRPSRPDQEAADTLRLAAPRVAQVLGRTPTTADLAAYLGWEAATVRVPCTAELCREAVSVDAMDGDAWMTGRPFESDAVEVRMTLRRVVQGLGGREQELLRMRFVDELTQVEMAARLGVTQMQVSRLLARLMGRMRAQIAQSDDPPGTGRTRGARLAHEPLRRPGQ